MDSDSKKELTAREISKRVQGELVGPGDIVVSGVSTLQQATETDLSFLGNKRYTNQVAASKASIVLVPVDFTSLTDDGRAWIKCSDPSEAFGVITAEYASEPVISSAGIHPSAVIETPELIHSSVHIGAHVVIGKDVEIGENSIVEAGCYVGTESRIGCSCRFFPNTTIRERSVIGNRVIIHSGTVIGSDGFGYIPNPDGHKKIPQVGYVQIDDDVEIGANVTIDRARFDRTWIKKGVKIDNLVQVAHNVIVGEHTFILAQVGISGSVRIGKRVILAGQAGVAGHIDIGDGATITAKTGLISDVEPGVVLYGYPAVPRATFWKQAANIQKLPELRKRIRQLEREVDRLKK